ncbi:hypothetical protein ACRRTK_000471 [Alexandromys fortis]
MTPRPGTMRLACMFSSILLFGAAGLLLFISLQDPVELTPQQVPAALPNKGLLEGAEPAPIAFSHGAFPGLGVEPAVLMAIREVAPGNVV